MMEMMESPIQTHRQCKHLHSSVFVWRGNWTWEWFMFEHSSLSSSHCEVTTRRSARPASRLCVRTASCVAMMAWMITATATAFTPRWPWMSLWPVSTAESKTGWRSRGMIAHPSNLTPPTTACPTLLPSSSRGAAWAEESNWTHSSYLNDWPSNQYYTQYNANVHTKANAK